MHRSTTAMTFAALGGILASAGCAQHDCREGECGAAPITHIVFVKLNDPSEAATLIRESRETLGQIRGVTALSVGHHLDTGRPTVDGDYDAGLTMGFRTAADYKMYVEHPAHVEFVKKWRPRTKWMRVYDIHDDTRANPT